MDEGEKTGDSNNSDTFNAPQSNHPRGHLNTRRYHESDKSGNTINLANLAENPNTPEFFNEAIIANSQESQPRNNKKRLILTVIIAIAVLCIVIFLVVLLTKNVTKQQQVSGLQKSFNVFANKLLFDKDSEEKIPAYDQNYRYAYMKKSYPEYRFEPADINNLITLYDGYLTLVDSSADQQEKELVENSYYIRDILQFLKAYSYAEELTYSDIYDLFVNTNEAEVIMETNKYLSVFSSSNNEYMIKFKEVKTEELNQAIKLSSMAKNKGCFLRGVNLKCIENVAFNDSNNIVNIGEHIIASHETATMQVQGAYADLRIYCWKISNLLESEAK